MSEISSIQDVVSAQLCTGCGTCAGLCPNDALSMVIDEKKGIYIPEVDPGLCNTCGICFKVCPGYEVDFEQLNQDVFGKQPDDPLLGNFLNCYTGHATDHDIRYNSSSGGLVTALLIYALEQGIIDGALVTRMKKDRPLEPEPFIARTREEIIEAATSKYCPVPANIALKEILRSKEGERFAVVGLPCHIHGVRKAQKYNKAFKEKIFICLGIMCARTDNFRFTEYILKEHSITPNNVVNIRYRGEGWPGYFVVDLNDGSTKKLFYEDYIPAHLLQSFTPVRCRTCIDAINQLSDAAFCDAWGIVKGDSTGSSICIHKTETGGNLLRKCIEDGAIFLESLPVVKLLNSQGIFSRSRIIQKNVNINLNKLLFRKKPIYPGFELTRSDYKPKLTDYMVLSMLRIQNIFLSRKIFWKLTKLVTKLEYDFIQKKK